mgnify:CR=1 FL=1
MRLTAKELEQMKSVDIGAVAPESLPDVSGMAFDTSLPREERIALFLQAVENPYCFCIGGIGVKIEFAESGPSLQDTLTDFLLRQKAGCNFGYSSFCFFETKCPEVEASLLSSPDRVII